MKRFSILALTLLALALPAFAQDPQLPAREQERLARHGGKHKGGKLKKMDTNQDGAVERNEWQGKPKKFEKLDLNHDGVITKEEIKARHDKRHKQ